MSAHTKKSDTVPERYVHLSVAAHSTLATHATVFARKTDDVWRAAVAYCSYSDAFSRKIGRNIARRRFFKPKSNNICLGAEFTYDKAERLALDLAP